MEYVFPTTATMGVNLEEVSTTPIYTPGARVASTGGTVSIYAKAAENIVSGNVVYIQLDTESPLVSKLSPTEDPATATSYYFSKGIGVAHVDIADEEWGWVCIQGMPINGINVINTTAERPLYLAEGQNGVLTSTVASGLILITGTAVTLPTTVADTVQQKAGRIYNPVIASGEWSHAL